MNREREREGEGKKTVGRMPRVIYRKTHPILLVNWAPLLCACTQKSSTISHSAVAPVNRMWIRDTHERIRDQSVLNRALNRHRFNLWIRIQIATLKYIASLPLLFLHFFSFHFLIVKRALIARRKQKKKEEKNPDHTFTWSQFECRLKYWRYTGGEKTTAFQVSNWNSLQIEE